MSKNEKTQKHVTKPLVLPLPLPGDGVEGGGFETGPNNALLSTGRVPSARAVELLRGAIAGLRAGTCPDEGELRFGGDGFEVRVKVPPRDSPDAGWKLERLAGAVDWLADAVEFGDVRLAWISLTEACGCGVRYEVADAPA